MQEIRPIHIIILEIHLIFRNHALKTVFNITDQIKSCPDSFVKLPDTFSLKNNKMSIF